jgi:dethiobiotin synthetase
MVFITGTDTGVGKTLVTALLLYYLRQHGCSALAIKPFCTGDRSDVHALEILQEHRLAEDVINPFFFREPIAPLVAARKQGRRISLDAVLRRIREVKEQCAYLLIEGAGGLRAPLGEGYSAADLITGLGCKVAVVGANKLGVINHTLLTVSELHNLGMEEVKVVLTTGSGSDISTQTNAPVLSELLGSVEVIAIPFLGSRATAARRIKKNCKKIEKSLARLAAFVRFSPVVCDRGKRNRRIGESEEAS